MWGVKDCNVLGKLGQVSHPRISYRAIVIKMV